MDRSDDGSEDSNGDGSQDNADEKKAWNGENDEMATGKDDRIGSDGALGSEGGGGKATRGIKAVDNSSSGGKPATNLNDEAFGSRKGSNKDDTCGIDSELLTQNVDEAD
ncbi:hypothetical protein HOY82DRAFT_595518 [Tuber indicum]|nr:hypothetical protein HOY82DRAFT_595518 [Tuber indicum]